MIDKTELLRMIMENNPGLSPNAILEQYDIYLKGLDNVHAGSFISSTAVTVENVEMLEQSSKNTASAKGAKTSLTCGYTKRHLTIKPEDAIGDDTIACCICGKTYKTLTERHLAIHNGLTREGYLKLCGYSPRQPLMARNHLARMKHNVLKAQLSRKTGEKKTSTSKSLQSR